MSAASELRAERRQLAIQLPSGFAQLSYVAYEPPKARRTVLCLHDFLGNASDFSRLSAMLAGNGFRVLCPDLPGRGQSAYLSAADYNPHTYLIALVSLVQSLGNKHIAVVGKGWGGLLALGLAGTPEVSVSRLVLSDLGFPWMLEVDDTIVRAARGPGLPSLEEARRILAQSAEFRGLSPRRALSLIDGRLRLGDAGYGFDFDPALLSPDATARFAKVATAALFEGLSARLLYLSAGPLPQRERARLGAIMSAGSYRSVAENVSKSARVHFVSSHELLVTLGFLKSRFLPPV